MAEYRNIEAIDKESSKMNGAKVLESLKAAPSTRMSTSDLDVNIFHAGFAPFSSTNG